MNRNYFQQLFNPGRIGQCELKNRIVMAPMGTYLANRDGTIPERLKKYYEERAKGGAGLIIVEVAAIDYPRGRGMTRQIGISEDRFIQGLGELAEAVHRHEAKVAIQLHHAGRIAAPFLSGGYEAVGPSVIPLIPRELGVTRELTADEIGHLIQCYAAAAVRARIAGLDGVEIHAGHGYLISQFLSRSTNGRQDQYGGDLANRARFLLEIIRETRKQVGATFPVWCRLDGQEFSIENGITREEASQIAQMAVSAGMDALHISGYGGSDNVHFTEAPLVNEPGYLLPLARDIKKTVKAPVIAVGRISPEFGERILSQNQADFIAFGRPLIADPEMPNKLMAGKSEDIRRCIYCYSCVHQIFVRNNISCSINAAAGKESEAEPQPPGQIKKVLIIGGGVAGMEAARVAASRGHRVVLYEKENRLGGSLIYASIIRRENEELVKYLVSQIRKLGVQIKLGENITPGSIEQLKPDVIIVATGGLRTRSITPGIENRNVIDGNDLRHLLNGNISGDAFNKFSFSQRTILRIGRILVRPLSNTGILEQISRWWMPLGRRIIILGGGLVGCELALFLAERGRIVTVLERSEQTASEMALPMKWIVLNKLKQHGVDIITKANFNEVNDRGIYITDVTGQTSLIEADILIEADGIEPDREMVAAFQGRAPEVYAVGDCSKLSLIKDSIADASKIALMI
jgi:2,4-dienoyl-CoA reductase-like NADH-dependent reductase (Old Yellow Enzyme family)/NADPH-dependent 2,4-dienoyl-CoA reductase/sulfur reductase-like enzyme